MADQPEPRITLHPLSSRVRILVGETVIADTCNALELREKGYPPRRYLPRADVKMERLSVSSTVTPNAPRPRTPSEKTYSDRQFRSRS